MAHKTDIGPLFFQKLELERCYDCGQLPPLFHRANTFEVTAPYRRSKAVVIRLLIPVVWVGFIDHSLWVSFGFKIRGLAIGWWRKNPHEDKTELRNEAGVLVADDEPGTDQHLAEAMSAAEGSPTFQRQAYEKYLEQETMRTVDS